MTAGEIVQKLHRSPGAIRNLRYKKHLVTRVQDESKALFHQRDELINVVKSLQGQKTSLAFEVEYLKKEKGRLGAVIAIDKARLEETLAQALMNLKNAEARLVHSVRSGANSCAVESVLEIARAKCDSWI